jgi:hypothetical protein
LLLRDLPLAPRLVLAAFLVSAGAGYASALVQLHFQAAAPGELLPGARAVEERYFGARSQPVSPVERLLEAEHGPLNGNGSMRPAFTTQSRGWDALVRGKTPEQLRVLAARREGERLAVLSWVRTGASRDAYDRDDHPLGDEFAHQEITPDFLVKDSQTQQPVLPRRVRLRTLLTARCVECHSEAGREGSLARLVPLDSYERLRPYCQAPAERRLSLERLAQTTHAHLFGLALLYGATGLIFSFTSHSPGVRIVFGPLPLVAQGVEIGCWWLARLHPAFAQAVLVAGVVVAVGLAVQVLGGLWDLFGRTGRAVLLALLLAALAAGAVTKVCLLDPYLQREKVPTRRLEGRTPWGVVNANRTGEEVSVLCRALSSPTLLQGSHQALRACPWPAGVPS